FGRRSLCTDRYDFRLTLDASVGSKGRIVRRNPGLDAILLQHTTNGRRRALLAFRLHHFGDLLARVAEPVGADNDLRRLCKLIAESAPTFLSCLRTGVPCFCAKASLHPGPSLASSG